MSHVFGEKFKFRCKDCDFKTKIEKTFAAHKANWCHPVKCDSCDFKTKNKQVMESHVKSKHTAKEKKQYVCEHCPEPKSFTALRSLEEHVQSVHLGVKRFYCEEANCDYGTFRQYELNYHMQMHTGEKSYRCEVGTKLIHSCHRWTKAGLDWIPPPLTRKILVFLIPHFCNFGRLDIQA